MPTEYEMTFEQRAAWGPQRWRVTVTSPYWFQPAGDPDGTRMEPVVGSGFAWTRDGASRLARRIVLRDRKDRIRRAARTVETITEGDPPA